MRRLIALWALILLTSSCGNDSSGDLRELTGEEEARADALAQLMLDDPGIANATQFQTDENPLLREILQCLSEGQVRLLGPERTGFIDSADSMEDVATAFSLLSDRDLESLGDVNYQCELAHREAGVQWQAASSGMDEDAIRCLLDATGRDYYRWMMLAVYKQDPSAQEKVQRLFAEAVDHCDLFEIDDTGG